MSLKVELKKGIFFRDEQGLLQTLKRQILYKKDQRRQIDIILVWFIAHQ